MGLQIGDDAFQSAMHGGEIGVGDVAESDLLEIEQEDAETGFEFAAGRGQMQANDATIFRRPYTADQPAAFQFVHERSHG